MKKAIILLLLATATTQACGPYFPPSYFSDADLIQGNINLPQEMQLLAQEYQLIDATSFPASTKKAAVTDLEEFRAVAVHPESVDAYAAYATAVRAEKPAQMPPVFEDGQLEFVLYMAGVQAIKANPELIEPLPWLNLLNLDPALRQHRTTWVHFMLGNLAAAHQQPEQASAHFAACRQAAKSGFSDPLGLAHASYKNEQMAQTNNLTRIRCGVQSVGYYTLAEDAKNQKLCIDHLMKDLRKLKTIPAPELNPVCTEARLLYGGYIPDAIYEKLATSAPLKMAPRMAWFMYQRGNIKDAERMLKNCTENDILANWLRFNIHQRNGENQKAIEHLTRWFHELQTSDRIVYSAFSAEQTLSGQLGTLLVKEDQIQKAFTCFLQSGSEWDALLIADRYLSTDALQAYLKNAPISERGELIQKLNYLMARRLFRENRPTDALAYYPEEIAEITRTYLNALAQSENKQWSRSVRSAHLFHAARILRVHGMEMSGTALGPDYQTLNGVYGDASNDELSVNGALPEIYRETAPNPALRFHYRYQAAELAEKAAQLTRDRHQKAAQLWTAGEWIQFRSPKEADVYYKQLARLSFQPLAKTADKLRWFPPATPELTQLLKSDQYIEPKLISQAARKYKQP
jgi:hypothetical protein